MTDTYEVDSDGHVCLVVVENTPEVEAPAHPPTATIFQGKYKSSDAWVMSVVFYNEAGKMSYVEHIRLGHIGQPEDLIRAKAAEQYPAFFPPGL